MTLRVRKPAGVAPWPLVLVESREPALAARVAYRIAAAARVGRTFVADLGGGLADQFDALGDYEVLELTGTRSDLVEQLRAVEEVDREKDDDGDLLPNAIVVDSGTEVWSVVNGWADEKARCSDAARRILAADPDASIERPKDLWNQIDARWFEVVQILRQFEGVAVMTARGGEVERAGELVYRVEAHQSLPFVADAWLHVEADGCEIRAAKSLDAMADPDLSDFTDPLEHLVFDVLGVRGFAPLGVRAAHVGLLRSVAKRRVVAALAGASTLTGNALREEAARRWRVGGLSRFDEVDELPADALDELLAKIEEEAAF